VLRDARSRNGTYLNGERLGAERELALGDRITLGEGGPDLVLESLTLPGGQRQDFGKAPAEALRPAGPVAGKPGAAARRSFAGKGKTVFFREMMEESTRKSASKLRVVIWSFVTVLAAAVGGGYWYTERQQQATARALAAADERTEALEGALRRAETALAQQLAAGDSAQRAAQGELARLRGELNRAAQTPGGGDSRAAQAVIDSLRAAIQAQEQKNAEIAAQVRAVKSVNLSAIAQASGPAVALVTGYRGGVPQMDGSGFVITPSGYLVTNKHVATDEGRAFEALYVRLADRRDSLRAEVAVLAPGDLDLALLRIRNYTGPVVPRIDWTGTRVRQGEDAALIGYPAGTALAMDFSSGTVKTSMSAGIFAQVTASSIRFNGFSVSGSSGSPLFNADGEVVAVHAAGLSQSVAQGQRQYAFAIPIPLLVPHLPADARTELGLR